MQANVGSVMRATSPILRVLTKDNKFLQELEKDFDALLKQREDNNARIHVLNIVEGLPLLKVPGMSVSILSVETEPDFQIFCCATCTESRCSGGNHLPPLCACQAYLFKGTNLCLLSVSL